jgi:hypothetical protein
MQPGCDGCALSQKSDRVIHLSGDWVVNHYQGQEGNLGWMVLQPRYHRMCLAELGGTRGFGHNRSGRGQGAHDLLAPDLSQRSN